MTVIVLFFSLPVHSKNRHRRHGRSYSSRVKSTSPFLSVSFLLSCSLPAELFSHARVFGGRVPGTVKYVCTYTCDAITLGRKICQRVSRIGTRLSGAWNAHTMTTSSMKSTTSTCRTCNSRTTTFGECRSSVNDPLIGTFLEHTAYL